MYQSIMLITLEIGSICYQLTIIHSNAFLFTITKIQTCITLFTLQNLARRCIIPLKCSLKKAICETLDAILFTCATNPLISFPLVSSTESLSGIYNILKVRGSLSSRTNLVYLLCWVWVKKESLSNNCKLQIIQCQFFQLISNTC